MSKKIKNLMFTCLFFLLVSGCAIAGWYIAKNAPQVSREEAVGAQNVMLSTDAKVTHTYIYRYCGHTHSETREVARAEVSMSEEEFADEHPNFVLEQFDEEGGVLVHRIDGYCPKHYILKIEQDALVLYRPMELSGVLERVREYEKPDELLEEEALTVGKVFASTAEVNEYIAEISENAISQSRDLGVADN